MLKCSDQTLYTGVTTDVPRRLCMHQNGTASKYTRSRRPVELVLEEACGDRSEALRKEHAIKRLSRTRKLDYCRRPWTKER